MNTGTLTSKALMETPVVLATVAADLGLQAGWKALTGKPEAAPHGGAASWGRPLAWAIVSGIAAEAVRVAAARATAAHHAKSPGRPAA